MQNHTTLPTLEIRNQTIKKLINLLFVECFEAKHPDPYINSPPSDPSLIAFKLGKKRRDLSDIDDDGRKRRRFR